MVEKEKGKASGVLRDPLFWYNNRVFLVVKQVERN
jgi:hypothetical protein